MGWANHSFFNNIGVNIEHSNNSGTFIRDRKKSKLQAFFLSRYSDILLW